MSAPKTLAVYKLLAKLESTPGTAVALADASDAIQVVEDPVMQTQYGWDGTRERPSGTLGQQIQFGPQGAWYNPSFKVADKGGGVAYSASVFPWDTHVFLQAAGFDAAGSFGAGTEKWTYTPTAGTAVPKTLCYKASGNTIPGGNTEEWAANFVYCDWQYDVGNGKPAYWTFPTFGRRNAAPTEVAWSNPTYHHTVIPAIAAPLSLSVNGVTTLTGIESISVKGNRTINPRFPDHSQSGLHGGFHPYDRTVTVTFKVEKPAFSTINFHSLEDAGTPLAVTFQAGTTQYFRRKWTFAQVQIKGGSIAESDDNGRPMIEVTCQAYNSTPTTNDDVSVVAD